RSNVAPITYHYAIHHRPRLVLRSETDPGTGRAFLDASGSTSPDGLPLTISWYRNGLVASGPVYATTLAAIDSTPLTLRADDGHSVTFDLITKDEKTGKPVLTQLQRECIGMEVARTDKSLLNP